MKKTKEELILSAIKQADPKKKRVTFFLSEVAKSGLAKWCNKNNVSESSAIEQMIRSTIPAHFFREEK